MEIAIYLLSALFLVICLPIIHIHFTILLAIINNFIRNQKNVEM